jgi:hypothetical protein
MTTGYLLADAPLMFSSDSGSSDRLRLDRNGQAEWRRFPNLVDRRARPYHRSQEHPVERTDALELRLRLSVTAAKSNRYKLPGRTLTIGDIIIECDVSLIAAWSIWR